MTAWTECLTLEAVQRESLVGGKEVVSERKSVPTPEELDLQRADWQIARAVRQAEKALVWAQRTGDKQLVADIQEGKDYLALAWMRANDERGRLGR